MGHKKQNENTAGYSYGKTNNIDGRKILMFDDVSYGNF